MNAARNLLWLLIVLILVETVVREFAPSIWLTTFHVLALVIFALIHGALRYGWRGIVAFIVICLVVSNFFENLSILTGFPFGHYHYTDVLGPKLFLVPLLIGPAYLGVGYLAWVLGTILVGDVRRGASGLATFAAPFVAAFIMVFWDLCLDPGASTIGHWWIWHDGGGFFGVPLSNYLGWYFTVYLFLQLFALYLRAAAPEPERPQPEGLVLPGDRHVRDLGPRLRPRLRRRQAQHAGHRRHGKDLANRRHLRNRGHHQPPHHGLRGGGDGHEGGARKVGWAKRSVPTRPSHQNSPSCPPPGPAFGRPEDRAPAGALSRCRCNAGNAGGYWVPAFARMTGVVQARTAHIANEPAHA